MQPIIYLYTHKYFVLFWNFHQYFFVFVALLAVFPLFCITHGEPFYLRLNYMHSDHCMHLTCEVISGKSSSLKLCPPLVCVPQPESADDRKVCREALALLSVFAISLPNWDKKKAVEGGVCAGQMGNQLHLYICGNFHDT